MSPRHTTDSPHYSYTLLGVVVLSIIASAIPLLPLTTELLMSEEQVVHKEFLDKNIALIKPYWRQSFYWKENAARVFLGPLFIVHCYKL